MPGLLVDLEAVRREAGHFFTTPGVPTIGSIPSGYSDSLGGSPCERGRSQHRAAGGLLHDIGRDTEFHAEGRICHAAVGAALARDVMEKLGLEHSLAERICHCIASHRYRGEVRPQTIEAEVLFDADKLDSIGAVGIGRAFLFAGEVGARLHDPAVDPEKSQPYTPDDTAYREYLVKLRHIKDRTLTETGREIAESRHRYMTEFFDRLNKEVQGIL